MLSSSSHCQLRCAAVSPADHCSTLPAHGPTASPRYCSLSPSCARLTRLTNGEQRMLRRQSSVAAHGRRSTANGSRGQNTMTRFVALGEGSSSRGSVKLQAGEVLSATAVEVELGTKTHHPQQQAEGEVEAKGGKREAQFQWEKQWYPAAILRDLDPRLPTAVTILGLPLVIWWDSTSTDWRVFQDYCPHRLAPLSEGRIHESGHLQCSYHGWTFDATGSCTSIPQQPKDGPPVHTSPRACARVVPSQSHQGMLWVWPDGSPSAADESRAAPPPPSVPEMDDPQFHFTMGCTDLPFGYEILVENVLDPSHVPFAHHRFQGNRNQGKPLSLRVRKIDVGGVRGASHSGGPFNFLAPSTITWEIPLPVRQTLIQKLLKQPATAGTSTPPKLIATFFPTPTLPGESRLFYAFVSNGLPPIARMIPRWLVHQDNFNIFDSDSYLLHILERKLAAAGGSAASSRVYFTPATADAFVSAFRKWLNDFAGQGPSWPPSVDTKLPPSPSKAVIMDKQRGHVKHCLSCQKAQRGFEMLRKAFWVASVVILAGLVAAPSLRPTPLPPRVAAFLVLLSGICAAFAAYLGGFIYERFVYREHIHALWD